MAAMTSAISPKRVSPAGEQDPPVESDIRGKVADALGVVLVSVQFPTANDEPDIRPLQCDLGRRPNEDVGTFPRIESGDEAHDWSLRVDPQLGPDPRPADRWMKLTDVDSVRDWHDRSAQPGPSARTARRLQTSSARRGTRQARTTDARARRSGSGPLGISRMCQT